MQQDKFVICIFNLYDFPPGDHAGYKYDNLYVIELPDRHRI